MGKNDMPALRVGLEQARALRITKQELVDPPGGDVADVVVRTGWVRTLGGIDVYPVGAGAMPEDEARRPRRCR